MKRIIYFGIGVLLIACFACERDLMSYEGTESVYFAAQSGNSWGSENDWPYSPYTDVEFVKVVPDTLTVFVKVMITGQLKDYPRSFRVEINPDSTTAREGVHFDVLSEEYVIAANKNFGHVPIKLHRQPDMKNEIITIGLRLLPNENFSMTFPQFGQPAGHTNSGVIYEGFDVSLHKVRISDLLVQPSEWAGSVNAEGKESGTMGAFTEKKFKMMCEMFDLTYNDFMDKTVMSYMMQLLISQHLSMELIKRKDKGDPVLEDDDRLMWIDGCPWESFIGVPYVPENK